MADAPFLWSGNTGGRLTADEIAQQRKDAATLMQQGTDASAFPAGTRGAGVWTQGLARVAKAMWGGYEAHQADEASKQNVADNQDMMAKMAAIINGQQAPAVTAAPGAPVASAAPVATAVTPPTSTGTIDPEMQGYINAAAKKYGIDPAYLTRTAILESHGDPNAVNPVSGAKGLFQFMPKTAKEYELDNPLDPEDAADAAAELARDNRDALKAALGRDPTNAELYLAHQQGAAGAAALLTGANKPATDSVGLAAVMNNGGAQGMTGNQFANMWLKKYGNDQPAPYAVASNGPSIPVPATVPAAAVPTAAPPAPAAVARVASALQPAALPTNTGPAVPLSAGPQTNTGPAVPGNFSMPGFPAPTPAPTPAPSDDGAALPPAATPTQGSVAPAPVAAPDAVARVAAAIPATAAPATPRVNPAVLSALTSPYADATTKQIAGLLLQQQMKPRAQAPYKDADGNLLQMGPDGTLHAVIQADKDPTSVKEYEYYQSHLGPGETPMPYDQWSTAKARAAATNVTTNVDTKPSQTYSSTMAEGLAKAHGALANGVEDAQARARDIAAMQGAIDAIQKNGGTTGGLAPEQQLYLQKSINAGAAALGIEKPFSEADLSDKEFLTKFNRSMAGAQAKNAVGSRVTNFELQNFLKANPGIDMTITGNQRLLGIQAQIEQRNIAVGNAIRDATAAAMSQGKDVSPVVVQKIITDYDQAHHIKDPVTGQDLTQSLALPEFQNQGTNASLAATHVQNMQRLHKTIGDKTYHTDDGGKTWFVD